MRPDMFVCIFTHLGALAELHVFKCDLSKYSPVTFKSLYYNSQDKWFPVIRSVQTGANLTKIYWKIRSFLSYFAKRQTAGFTQHPW